MQAPFPNQASNNVHNNNTATPSSGASSRPNQPIALSSLPPAHAQAKPLTQAPGQGATTIGISPFSNRGDALAQELNYDNVFLSRVFDLPPEKGGRLRVEVIEVQAPTSSPISNTSSGQNSTDNASTDADSSFTWSIIERSDALRDALRGVNSRGHDGRNQRQPQGRGNPRELRIM